MTQTHEQTEAFPRSTMEILEQLRGVHQTAYEKAVDALHKLDDDEEIAKRYNKAEEKVAGCRELVRNIDLALEEMRGMDVQHHVSEMKRHAEESGTQVTISAGDTSVTFGAGVDPITGEVESATPVVVAVYPGDDPRATEVGDHTQYAELVADYLASAGIDAELNDFEVVAEDEVGTNGGGGRNLHAPIQRRDYGKRLLVRRVAEAAA